MKKWQNLFFFAGLAIFGVMGCGGDEKSGTSGNQDQKTGQDCAQGSGKFGPDCKPCTCKNGVCQDGNDGNGECSSCDSGYLGKNCDSMADTKGQLYKVTKIADQVWMAENMATDQAADGSQVSCLANTKEDSDFVKNYGCLYTWENAMKVCPAGWHLPTETELNVLFDYVSTDSNGDKLAIAKNLRSANWPDKEYGAGLDKYGFSALPTGCYIGGGEYRAFGFSTDFWSSTEYKGSYAHKLSINSSFAYTNYDYKTFAFPVRCVKD